jgi:hypothetical protein
MKRICATWAVVILCGASTVQAANRSGDNWYFGEGGGVTFASGSPLPLAGGLISTDEGCATISDANGNLLFYTDGIIVRNAIHQIMPHGTGLLGDSSSTQSAVVVPYPGSSNLFILFTADTYPGGIDGLNYSIVDMTLDSGRGDIDTNHKNINLMDTCSEQLSATPNSDNTGYWVLARAINTNGIYAFAITSSGVNATPVISNVGTTTDKGGELGYLKPSTLGNKLAMAYYFAGKAELYDFNAATGQVSNVIDLGAAPNAYGVEFSQSGDRLYVSSLYDSIQQFDLTAGNIPASKVQIASTGPGALQLGPDGKIYGAEYDTTLDVISLPEVLGVGCNFQAGAVPIAGMGAYGLPTFIQSFFSSVSAPTATTTTASSITITTATSGGDVTADGGAAVTARGVCWSTSHNPTTSDTHTSNGTGTGIFTSSITSLTSSTLYYVRAYATNSAGTGYGSEVSFATNALVTTPTVTTTAASTVTTTSATSGGNVTADGGAAVIARGVCWSTSPNPTTEDSVTSDGTGTGSFSSAITGLLPGTTYYVRAYATNSAGTSYGTQISFTTSNTTPTLTTTAASSITSTSAQSGGNITSTGGAAVTARGVCWSTSPNPITEDGITTDGTGTGSFSSAITGLLPGTTYYVRAYATNSAGTGYGEDAIFVTLAAAPDIVITDSNGSDSVLIGDTIAMAFTVGNQGNGDATAVQFSFTVPDNVEFVSASLDDNPSADLIPLDAQVSGSTVTLLLGDLGAGVQLQVRIILRGESAGDVRLEISVISAESDTRVSKTADSAVTVQDAYDTVVHSTKLNDLCGIMGVQPFLATGMFAAYCGKRRRKS